MVLSHCRNLCLKAPAADAEVASVMLGSAAMHLSQAEQEKLLTVTLDACLVEYLICQICFSGTLGLAC